MPSLKFSVPHTLPKESLQERLRGLADNVKRQYGEMVKDVHEEQVDDSTVSFGFRTMGQSISGTVKTTDSEVHVEMSLPFAVAMFKGRIEKGLREEIERRLK